MRYPVFFFWFSLLFALSALLPTAAISSRSSSALVLTEAEQAWIDEHPVIKVRISKSYPPFEFYADGSYQGLAYDHLVALGERLGLIFEPTEEMAWGDALQKIEDKDGVDLILLITHTPERESFLNFTRDYITFPEVIFTRKDGLFVSGFDDLGGHLVATENDFVEAETLLRDIPDVQLLETETTAEALQAVALGKADAYVGNLAVGSYLIDKLGLVDLKIAAPTPYGEDAYAMGVRKDWPELVGILEKGLGSLSPADYQNVRRKWLAIRYEHGLNMYDIARWVLLVFLVSMAFIIQLRRMVKARTRELRASQSLLQVVQDNAFQFTGLLTPEGVLLDTNRTALEFVNTKKEDVVGKLFWDTPWWSHSPALQEQLRRAVKKAAQGEIVRYETTHLGTAGEVESFDFSLKPVINESGAVIYLVPSGHNVTELKELQAKAIRSSQLESLGVLAAGVAHEVNNPITGVINYAQMLLNKAGEDSRSREILERIIKEADRVAAIVKGLLSFARDDNAHFEPLNMVDIVDEALSLCGSQIARDGIDLDVACADELPLVRGNLQQLVQLFLNLFSNARYALNEKSPESRAEKKLSIEMSRVMEGPAETVRVTVFDNGTGIPDEVCQTLFKTFVTTKPAGQGTGLGLSICNDIVTNHDGIIKVESEQGQYAKFIIDLPAVKE